MTKLAIVILSFLIFSCTSLYAQEGSFAITDQQVYITGEKIWVSGFVGPDANTTLVEVLLLNREGRVVSMERAKLKDGVFFLDMQLRGELKTDNYVVCCRMGNVLKHFTPVMVINPVMPPDAHPAPALQSPIPDGSLKITTNGSSFAPRQKVEVAVDSLTTPIYYFVSAFRDDALGKYADSLFSGWTASDIAVPGITTGVNGRVVDADGKSVAGVQVSAALLSDQSELGYGISSNDGSVHIDLLPHYTDLPVAVEIHEGKGLRFIPAERQDVFELSSPVPVLNLPERFIDDISARLLSAETGNKLADKKMSILQDNGLDTLDIYGKPDKRYMLDNYVRFPDMREVITEFIPEVRVRKLNGQTALQVVNTPYKIFFDLPALVLLDGVPVADIDQLLAMDPLKIRSIDIVARKFLIGNLQIPGIVHYKTYKTDMAGYKLPADVVLFDHKGLRLPAEPLFVLPGDERMPYLNNLSYWRSPAKDLRRFSFPASDEKADYRIRVVAVDGKGKRYAGSAQISVK